MNAADRELRDRLEHVGQAHILAFFDEIGDVGRARLGQQIEGIDWALVDELAELVRRPVTHETPSLSPPEVFPLRRGKQELARAAEAVEVGARRLRAGQVAYVLVAGGQASRLGFEGPKGAFPVGPVSGRTLFEVFARRLHAARERYDAPTAWYVMTSQANDAATRAFFAAHDHFGLAPEDLFFFEQAMLPALDRAGRVLMSAKDSVFLAPTGHGGVLAALDRSGALAHARARGVESLSYFQVDNPLARPADPLFLGLHALEGAEMSSKVVLKRGPDEKVGVLGRIDGRLSCIEYSDMPPALRTARRPDGELLYGAGNIALHVIELPFAAALAQGELRLPWHIARKHIGVVDSTGCSAIVEGRKFETFVFDALQRTQRSVILEVDRALEFSPVKNASGEDSPATARAELCRLYAGWASRAGQALPTHEADGTAPVEVDPVFAECEPEFHARMPCAPQASARGHFYR